MSGCLGRDAFLVVVLGAGLVTLGITVVLRDCCGVEADSKSSSDAEVAVPSLASGAIIESSSSDAVSSSSELSGKGTRGFF